MQRYISNARPTSSEQSTQQREPPHHNNGCQAQPSPLPQQHRNHTTQQVVAAPHHTANTVTSSTTEATTTEGQTQANPNLHAAASPQGSLQHTYPHISQHLKEQQPVTALQSGLPLLRDILHQHVAAHDNWATSSSTMPPHAPPVDELRLVAAVAEALTTQVQTIVSRILAHTPVTQRATHHKDVNN